MKRRKFVTTFLTGTVGAVILQACGGGDSTGGAGGGAANNAGADDCTETISANHGHTIAVTDADVQVGAEKTYDIQGTAGHPHSVTVTAADFQVLQDGGTVTKTSTNNAGHTHDVTIQCT